MIWMTTCRWVGLLAPRSSLRVLGPSFLGSLNLTTLTTLTTLLLLQILMIEGGTTSSAPSSVPSLPLHNLPYYDEGAFSHQPPNLYTRTSLDGDLEREEPRANSSLVLDSLYQALFVDPGVKNIGVMSREFAASTGDKAKAGSRVSTRAVMDDFRVETDDDVFRHRLGLGYPLTGNEDLRIGWLNPLSTSRKINPISTVLLRHLAHDINTRNPRMCPAIGKLRHRFSVGLRMADTAVNGVVEMSIVSKRLIDMTDPFREDLFAEREYLCFCGKRHCLLASRILSGRNRVPGRFFSVCGGKRGARRGGTQIQSDELRGDIFRSKCAEAAIAINANGSERELD